MIAGRSRTYRYLRRLVLAALLISVPARFDANTTEKAKATDSVDGAWTEVVGDGLGGGNGFGDPANSAIYALADYHDALYAGTVNMNGAEIYQTTDGVLWAPAGSLGVPTTGGITTLIEFNDRLYATTLDLTLGGGVFRTSSTPAWTQVVIAGFGDSANQFIMCSHVFGNHLYVGTLNDNGCEVWRSPNGEIWSQVNVDGFGNPSNEGALSITVFHNELWVGVENHATGAELWKSADGVNWTQAMESGFGDADNKDVRVLAVFDGALYAATANYNSGAEIWRSLDGLNWAQVVDAGFGASELMIPKPFLVDYRFLLTCVHGPSASPVWISEDGTDWAPDSSPGFDDPETVGIVGLSEWRGDIYAGTSHTAGCEIWRRPGNAPLFRDDFESGGTTVWTTVPPP